MSQDRRVADATAVGGADTASANAPPRLAAAAPDDPLPRLQALLGGATAGITWQLAARTLPHGDEQQRWWAQLRDGTQGRWRRDFAPQATPQPWVTLAVGGRALATLSIDGTFLRLRIGADQWQVVLSAAQALDWQQAVARW